MNYYKITNKEENHHGLQYKTGLNIDILPFNPSGTCEPGGIYIAKEDILAFLNYGPWIRKATLLDDGKIYEDKGYVTKYKVDKVILGKRREINVNVIRELLDEGANVHADNDYALRWASENGHTETVKLLLDRGANVHADNDYALQWASYNGHTETVKLLLDRGANIHNCNDYALRWASLNGHTETVKLLLDRGADIHADDDSALQWASYYGHTEIVKLLLDRGANIHTLNNIALRCASENGHTETVKVLKKYMDLDSIK